MGCRSVRQKSDCILILIHVVIQVLIVLLITTGGVFGDLYRFQNVDYIERRSVTKREEQGVRYRGEIDNLRGKPGQGYQIEVEIGTPKQKLNVLIDTGSSNFAVACADDPDITTYFKRDASSTYRDLDQSVHVPYTEGSWDGELGNDLVSIPSLPNVTVHANIACITKSKGFYINGSNWQGILGLGYAAISRPDSSIEPFMDSLIREGGIENYFTMVLCGKGFNLSDPEGDLGGSLLFGGSDTSLYTGSLYSTPIVKEWYYETVIVDIEVDHVSLSMDCKEYNFGKTIVDSGTTNLRLPTKVYNALIANMRNTIQSQMSEDTIAGLCKRMNIGERDINEVFMLYDNKGDGKIGASQLGDVVRSLGQNPCEAEIRKCGYAGNPDARISFEVFLPILQSVSRDKVQNRPDEFVEGFRLFDKENNGYIQSAELRHILTCLGDKLTDEEVDQLFQGQEDAQGNINYEEFVKMVLSG